MLNQQIYADQHFFPEKKNPNPVKFYFRQLQGHWIGVKTQTKSLYTMILVIENVCIKYRYLRINSALLIRFAKNGSVEQASCVPGDVEVKSDPLYSCKFCYYLYRSYA